jgi:tetratricopeptide (TPR) repeat protein
MQPGLTPQQLFEKFKTFPEDSIRKKFPLLIEALMALDRKELIRVAESLYNNSEPAKQSPALFSYARAMLAFAYFYTERYDEALPLLTETLQLMTARQDADGIAACTLMTGSIYRTYGNVDLGFRSVLEAYQHFKTSPDFHFFFLASCITLAGIYADRTHYKEAIPLYEEGLALAREKANYYWMIYALHGLAKTYLAESKFPEAKQYLEEAMRSAEASNNAVSISNSLSELGNYYYGAGDFHQAETYQLQSLAIREKSNFTGGAITNCIRLGEIYIAQFQPDKAVFYLEKGLALGEQIHVKLKMYQIHLLLSDIYQRNNDPSKALLHYKLYHGLYEEVEHESNARKIKNAQFIFEAEQTKKENVTIKKQKAEIEKKNIALQETIDELTLARIGKKARAITLIIAIILFIFEDTILHFALTIVSTDNYFISLFVKMVIIFSLSPINKAVEKALLKKVIKKKKHEVIV